MKPHLSMVMHHHPVEQEITPTLLPSLLHLTLLLLVPCYQECWVWALATGVHRVMAYQIVAQLFHLPGLLNIQGQNCLLSLPLNQIVALLRMLSIPSLPVLLIQKQSAKCLRWVYNIIYPFILNSYFAVGL